MNDDQHWNDLDNAAVRKERDTLKAEVLELIGTLTILSSHDAISSELLTLKLEVERLTAWFNRSENKPFFDEINELRKQVADWDRENDELQRGLEFKNEAIGQLKEKCVAKDFEIHHLKVLLKRAEKRIGERYGDHIACFCAHNCKCGLESDLASIRDALKDFPAGDCQTGQG